MTKILMYSDLHIGAPRVSLEKVIDTLIWVNQVAKQENCDYIFNLGDTFDFYNHTKSKMSLTPSMIRDLESYGYLMKGHYILRGNHEYNEQGDLIDIFSMYGGIPVTEPKFIEPLDILLLPYNESKYELDYDKYKYIFGHYDVSGAMFESGSRDESEDSLELSGLSWDMMFIGHYHIKQKIRDNIISIGAVQSRARSNNLEKMGITILDTVTGKTEFIENPYAEYEVPEERNHLEKKVNSSLSVEVENFKLEKSGLEAIIEYTKSKKGAYEDSIVDYTVEFLESLRN